MAVSLTLRSTKGSPLTHDEVDANFTSLATAAELPSGLLGFKPTVGRLFTNSVNGTVATNAAASAADVAHLVPFLIQFDCTVDEISVNVATNIAAAAGKLGMFRSDANKRPSTLIFENTAVSFATTGVKTSAIASPVTLSRGEVVWCSVRHSHASVVLSGPQLYNMLTIDYTSLPSSANKFIRKTGVTYASAIPNPWVFADADLTVAIGPLFGLKVAS